MRRLTILPQAELDVSDAVAWHEERRTGLGDEFLDELDSVLQRVIKSPFQFPKIKNNIRRALLRRFPYSVLLRCDQRNRGAYRASPPAPRPTGLGKTNHRRIRASWPTPRRSSSLSVFVPAWQTARTNEMELPQGRSAGIAYRKFVFLLANIWGLMWGNLFCTFKTSLSLSLREAPWSAVAAATAFRLGFIPKSRNSQNEKGGSCCYRTPRRASPA